MALYRYEAFSKDGKKTKGTVDAASLAAVREQLTRQGLFIVAISAILEGQENFFARLFGRGVSAKEKILFTKQLSILLKSGIPMLQAFELLTEQFTGKLHSMIIAIKDMIKEGSSLADALSKYPRTFEMLYVQLVRAGEASGKLDMILERLVQYLERKQALDKKIKGALQMPMIQLIVALLVVGVLMIFVVPMMVKNFMSQGKELPGPTKLLMAISSFMVNNVVLVLITLAVVVVSFQYWKLTARGSRQLDQLKLHLPLIKYLTKTNAVVQFSYTLGLLLEGGVHLSEALDIVVKVIDNRVLATAISEARDKIIKQGKIAQYLKQTNVFPPIAIYLIETGEGTGQLDKMLLTVAHNYEEEVTELTDKLTAALGPIMLLFMATMVGFIAIAIALPMVQMMNVAKF
jgi:type IV pilus assembly protein PilC